MQMVMRLVALMFALGISLSGALADRQVLRMALLKFGTVNWEIDTIRSHGLDKANGFTLEVQDVAGSSAAQVAFQGGETDVIVSDWIWVARQRSAGSDYVFIPYSKAVGGLMVPAASKAETLSDLKGRKIGIAGGPLDKSWIILQAYAEKKHNLNLADETEQVFGGAPLIFNAAMNGEVDGAINFWHFQAKMAAGGMRELISVAEAASALGLDPETPLLGYVVHGKMVRENPELVQGLADASRAAKELLMREDAEWDRLRPIMNAENDVEFEALKRGFRDGIPKPDPVNEASAFAFFEIMAKLGGKELVGEATELPAGLFFDLGS